MLLRAVGGLAEEAVAGSVALVVAVAVVALAVALWRLMCRI